MSGEPAEKPAIDPAQSNAQSGGGEASNSEQVTVSAQFKREALEHWKPAAEKVNKLEAQLQEQQRRFDELQRQVYGGGQAATDPDVELVRQLQEQAQYDPVARMTLRNTEMTLKAQAEAWLSQQLVSVPESKRPQVAEYIRAKGYQVDAQSALNVLTDPDTKTLQQKLAEMQTELERLRGARPNGVSPAAAAPAAVDAGDGKVKETVTPQEYAATLQAGGPAARALMDAVKSGQTKLVPK